MDISNITTMLDELCAPFHAHGRKVDAHIEFSRSFRDTGRYFSMHITEWADGDNEIIFHKPCFDYNNLSNVIESARKFAQHIDDREAVETQRLADILGIELQSA